MNIFTGRACTTKQSGAPNSINVREILSRPPNCPKKIKRKKLRIVVGQLMLRFFCSDRRTCISAPPLAALAPCIENAFDSIASNTVDGSVDKNCSLRRSACCRMATTVTSSSFSSFSSSLSLSSSLSTSCAGVSISSIMVRSKTSLAHLAASLAAYASTISIGVMVCIMPPFIPTASSAANLGDTGGGHSNTKRRHASSSSPSPSSSSSSSSSERSVESSSTFPW
mmetsp:Transcript_64259/g.75316  ORF Transcript_64259/g.75316 Transcript_64259/m.75316 type:complete len:225 (+) Transcript_64259:546-1220(+)